MIFQPTSLVNSFLFSEVTASLLLKLLLLVLGELLVRLFTIKLRGIWMGTCCKESKILKVLISHLGVSRKLMALRWLLVLMLVRTLLLTWLRSYLPRLREYSQCDFVY